MLELCKDGRIEIEEFILNLPGVHQLIGTKYKRICFTPMYSACSGAGPKLLFPGLMVS